MPSTRSCHREDEPRPSKDEIAKLVAWVTAGAKPSAAKIDPTIAFDKIKPAKGPKPISAIAYTLGDQIALVGNEKIAGVDLLSKNGHLVPVPQQTGAAPFTFLLSNTNKQITYGTLGRQIPVGGEMILSARYTGNKDEKDLVVMWGIGPQPFLARYRFDEIIAVGRFGSVEIYREGSEKADLILDAPGKVHALEFSRSGKQLVAATGVGGIRGEAILWDSDTGKELHRFKGHRDAMYAVAISDDGALVATGSYDRQIMVWDTESGKQLRTLRGHNGAIYDLAFSTDGQILASASADATVKIWNVSSGERLDTLGQPLKGTVFRRHQPRWEARDCRGRRQPHSNLGVGVEEGSSNQSNA